MAEKGQPLNSWKEIAAYLNRTVRTCQRLESGMGLPVHRLDGSPKAHVFAYPNELDAWLSEMIHERGRKQKTRRLWAFLVAGLAVVVAVAAIFINVFRPAPEANSVAVLVHDLSLGPGWEHLPDGIAEAVRNTLMQVQSLRVPGKASSDAVRDRKLDVREVGRILKVENLLELGVQVAGKDLRVTARLLKVKDGYPRWSNQYDRQIGDILDIQDDLSRVIVDQLKVNLLPGEQVALSKHPTEDLEAYHLYWKGRFLLGRPRPEAPREALRLFEKAIERDPKYALAYTGIAWVYMNMISQILVRPTEVGPKAESAVQRALALAPDLAEAHALNAWVQFLYNFDWDAAGKSFRRALELKPGDAMTRGMYAFYLLTRKRFEEARKEIKSALASDPFMPVLSAYSMWIHLYTGRSEEVLEEFKRVQVIEPNFEFAHFGAGMAYLNLGRIDESVEMLKKACSLPHTNMRPEAGLAVAYLRKGDRKAAEALYRTLLEKWEKSHVGSPINLAWVAASLGDLDRAFDFLETAVRERDPHIPTTHVFAERLFPELARDPRFLAILDRLHLPH